MNHQPPATIAGLVGARASDPRPGLLAGDTALSWADVVAAAAVRAAYLTAHRRPGPFHVATLFDNTVEHVLWLAGAALAGAVVVGGNPTHRGDELARDLAHTQCQLLVTVERYAPLAEGRDLGEALGVVGPDNERVLVVDAPGAADRLAPFAGAALPDPAATGVEPDTLGYLIFTSGTSGAPKACRCTQGRLARIGTTAAGMLGLTADDVCYCAMPLFHSNALMACFAPALVVGATLALPTDGRFSASGFLDDVRRYRVTYCNYVGKPLSYILATPPRPDDADTTLRRVFGNEAAAGDVDRFAERFGCVVTDAYGSTEGGASVARTPDSPPGALGRAPEGTVVLNPETGEECAVAVFDAHGRLTNPDEAIGELVSKSGAAGFEGYWQNDDAERARLREGWFWTGDLAYRDAAGFFYFAGRDHDWLRVDGENFAAAPVERIVCRHPDVLLAAVYAVPDPAVGDQVMVTLQLRPEAGPFDPEGFARFLAAQEDLGTKSAPRFVRITPALPVTATSKVLTRTLRAERWHSADPIWWRPTSSAPYQRLAPEDVTSLDAAVGDRLA